MTVLSNPRLTGTKEPSGLQTVHQIGCLGHETAFFSVNTAHFGYYPTVFTNRIRSEERPVVKEIRIHILRSRRLPSNFYFLLECVVL